MCIPKNVRGMGAPGADDVCPVFGFPKDAGTETRKQNSKIAETLRMPMLRPLAFKLSTMKQ
jgi:hypothetical protein